MTMRAAPLSRRLSLNLLLMLGSAWACNQESVTTHSELPDQAKASVDPVVASANPSAAPQDTTLDVQVLGSGFDLGSRAEFVLNGVAVPGVRTNRTTYRTPKELVANITIAPDAVPDRYDIAVTTSKGKKGIGTERFAVLALQVLGSNAFGLGVNSAGTAVGYVSVPTTCGGASNRPVVWTETGGLRQLPIPAGTCTAASRSINDAGVIAGSVGNDAYRWLPSGGESWTPQSLGAGGAPQGINRAGDIVMLQNDGNVTALFWTGTVWTEESGIVHLPNRPGATSGCSSAGINNLRQVVGRCMYTGNNTLTPVIWQTLASEPTPLPPLPGIDRYSPKAVNDAGVIVGTAFPPAGGTRAVRWVPSGSTWVPEDLGSLGGNSEAQSINNRGQIVGFSRISGSVDHAFVWEQSSGMRDLGALGTQSSQAQGMSDPTNGQPTYAAGWSYVSTTPQMVRWRIE
jgi:probable HAF family extracellular repeat protein